MYKDKNGVTVHPDYVIEMNAIGGPCWITSGEGDPARTHNILHAERYATEQEARENARSYKQKYQRRDFHVRILPC